MMVFVVFTGCQQETGTDESTSADQTEDVVTTDAEDSDETSAGTEEEITLTFVNWGSAEEAVKPAFDAMCAAFTEMHPNVTIEMVAFPYNDVKNQLLIMSAGGNAPDVAQVKAEWVSPLYSAGVLQPLDDLISEEALDDYYDGLLAGGVYDGQLVSVPWTPSPVCLYYNKALLEQAGYSEPADTWEKLIEQSNAIANLGTDDNGNKIYGIGFSTKQLTGAGYFFLANMWQNGGDFTDDDGNIVLNSEGNIAAFTEIQNLVQNGTTPEGLEIAELRSLFAQGQLGFMPDIEVALNVYANESPKGEEFKDEVAPMYIPGISSAQGETFALEHRLVVFKDSENAEMAAKFAEFLSSPESIQIYIELAGGKLPSRSSVESLEYYALEENSWLKTFSSCLSFAQSLPAKDENFLAACDEIAEAIQRVALNDEDPATVVADLDEAVKELYGQ